MKRRPNTALPVPKTGKTINAKLAECFKSARIAAGISKKNVASYLGEVPEDTIGLYESGRKPIPLMHVYALSNFLNVPPHVIMGLIHDQGE